jgi:multimeric flavodoxin WrbA
MTRQNRSVLSLAHVSREPELSAEVDRVRREGLYTTVHDASSSRRSVLVVSGSARADGNTARVVDRLRHQLHGDGTFIDLAPIRISPFTYDRSDDRDEFRSVVTQMLGHDQIVFATPVYWYAMSGIMKTFFDRLTDLLLAPDDRPLGRSLAGRDVWLLATGTDEAPPPGFHEPFALTAAYFDMKWRELFYVRSIRGAAPSEAELARVDCLAKLLFM